MTRRSYAGNTQPTTLVSPITNIDTSCTVVSGANYPDGTGGPAVLTIDAGSTGEEKVTYTSRTGNVFSGLTRGFDGTTAASHAAGATVRHSLSALDINEANQHVNDITLDQHTQYAFVSKTLAALRGAAGRSMKLHYGTDSGLLSVDDGTTWHEYQTKQAADAAYAPVGGTGITQAAADLRYLRLSTGGSAQAVTDQFNINAGATVQASNTSSAALVVWGLSGQSGNIFGVADQFHAFTFQVSAIGKLSWSQANSYGLLGTSVGAGGSASAMPTPAKYLQVNVDGTDYRIALFN